MDNLLGDIDFSELEQRVLAVVADDNPKEIFVTGTPYKGKAIFSQTGLASAVCATIETNTLFDVLLSERTAAHNFAGKPVLRGNHWYPFYAKKFS